MDTPNRDPEGERRRMDDLDARLKKARGTLTAECHCSVPVVTSQIACEVSADIRDAAGDIVARATVTWLLAPRRPNGDHSD